MPESEGLGHVYGRISDPEQRKGRGMSRQLSGDAEGFCRLYGFRLAKRVWVDDGVSAFKGIHLSPEHQLGQFLLAAKEGEIRKGDCLIIENWDRLSRQNIWAAIGLVDAVRQLGIHVGRLDRMKLLRCDSDDPGEFFEAAIELMRGHSESAAKSMRQKSSWTQRLTAARERGETVTTRLPAWLRVIDGLRVPIPEAKEAIRRVFALAASGYGGVLIVRQLEKEGVPAIGVCGRWTPAYVGQLLADRRVLGEFQPHDLAGKEAGGVLKGYFPAILSLEEWYAARAGVVARKRSPGRIGKWVNAFAGLVVSAIDQSSYCLKQNFPAPTKDGIRRPHYVLKSAAAAEGRAKGVTFPFASFEAAIFACLREVDEREILGDPEGVSRLKSLDAELRTVCDELGEASAFMEQNGFSATIGKRIAALEARQGELLKLAETAAREEATPLSDAWREGKGLLGVLKNAADPQDARIRVRSVLRRIVQSVWLLAVPRGLDRLAAVQIWFAGGERRRDYVILHRSPKGNGIAHREGRVLVGSLAGAISSESLDLRKLSHAERLQAVLSTIDLDDLERRLMRLQG